MYKLHIYMRMCLLLCRLYRKSQAHQFFIFKPMLLSAALHLICVLHSTPGSSCVSAQCCAGVTVLMRLHVWDDSIWDWLMGLICTNWKWSWSRGRGPSGAYCYHTSACLSWCMCLLVAYLCVRACVYLWGLSTYVRP